MRHGRDHIVARIATLKQKQLELKQQFAQNSAAGLDTSELEALLVTLTAEIAMLEGMLSSE
jgi:hypothetical protein